MAQKYLWQMLTSMFGQYWLCENIMKSKKMDEWRQNILPQSWGEDDRAD